MEVECKKIIKEFKKALNDCRSSAKDGPIYKNDIQGLAKNI